MNGRFVVVGCSHSANSGFVQNIDRHYVNLLKEQTGRKVINLAIGGMSNKEIYYRAVEFVLTNQVNSNDIFIVQWSSLHRLWVYPGDNNIDDFMQIIPYPCGVGDLGVAKKYNKLHTAYYCNSYIELKHWLTDMIALQSFFKQNKVKYLYVTGFDNLLSDLATFDFEPITSLEATPLGENLKNILDFDNRPDEYIIEKINVLIKLYSKLNFDHCVKFGDFYFGQAQLDRADDGQHWGIESNALWAKEILEHIKI